MSSEPRERSFEVSVNGSTYTFDEDGFMRWRVMDAGDGETLAVAWRFNPELNALQWRSDETPNSWHTMTFPIYMQSYQRHLAKLVVT